MRAREAKAAWTAVIVEAFYDWGERFGLCSTIPFERSRYYCISDRRIDGQIGQAFEKEYFGLMAVNVLSPVFGSGDQKTSISSIHSVGGATVMVLKNPEILKGLRPGIEWSVNKGSRGRVVR